MKTCINCLTEQPFDNFYKSKDKYLARCKKCLSEYHKQQNEKHRQKRLVKQKEYRENNKEKIKLSRKKHYENNRESILQKAKEYGEKTKEAKRLYDEQYRVENADRLAKNKREYYLRNKNRLLQYQIEYRRLNTSKISSRASAYKKNNRALFNHFGAVRRSQKIKASVKWANDRKILQIYSKAKRFKDWLGVDYHVDHIIPLQHPSVCGLHNEFNLQILTSSENIRKSNKFNPEDFEISFHNTKGKTNES